MFGVSTKVALGATEGLAVTQRSPSHHHDVSHSVSPGAAPLGDTKAETGFQYTLMLPTSGDNQNTDKPAYIGIPVGIRFQ